MSHPFTLSAWSSPLEIGLLTTSGWSRDIISKRGSWRALTSTLVSVSRTVGTPASTSTSFLRSQMISVSFMVSLTNYIVRDSYFTRLILIHAYALLWMKIVRTVISRVLVCCKWKVHPKNGNSVMNYSISSCSKPIHFFLRLRKIFGQLLVTNQFLDPIDYRRKNDNAPELSAFLHS